MIAAGIQIRHNADSSFYYNMFDRAVQVLAEDYDDLGNICVIKDLYKYVS